MDNENENKKTGAKKAPVLKPKKRAMYVDGVVNMASDMITTKEAFTSLWFRALKGADVDVYWDRAKAFYDALPDEE